MKTMSRVLAVLGGGVLLSAVAFQPAFANSSDYYVEQATSTLAGGNAVHVDASTVSASAVSDALDAANIGVVVLPNASVGGTLSSADIARQILAGVNGEFDTVLVYQENGNPGFASNSYDATTLSEAAYAPFNDGGSLQENVVESINAVEAISTGSPQAPPAGDDGVGMAVIGVVLGVAALGAGLTGWFLYMLMRLRRNKPSNAISAKISDTVPHNLSLLIGELQEIAASHTQLERDRLSGQLSKIIVNMQELFTRIKKKGTAGQIRVAEVEYLDKMSKLNEALGDGYYLDIAQHEELWDNSPARLEAVEKAVTAVEFQLVENIRQVNASKDLEFQVALDSLVGSMDSPNIKSIYNKKEKNL